MAAPATPPTAAYQAALVALQKQQRARLTLLIQQTEGALHREWQAGPALAAQFYRPVLDEYAKALADLRLAQDDPAAHLAVSWLNEQNAQLKSIEASVQASMANYAGQAARTVEEAQNAALARGTLDASHLTQEALFPASRVGVNPDVLFNRPNPDALALWVGRAGNGHPLGDLFKNFPAEATSEARKAMLFGLATGANPKAMASGIANAMGISRSRAIIISRTEVLGSYRAAAHETYRANADVLAGWLWSASGNNPCFPAGTRIRCEDGLTRIERVRVGMKVLTHHGRYRRVTAIMERPYVGNLIAIYSGAYQVMATPEHPFLASSGEWVEAKGLHLRDRIVREDGTSVVVAAIVHVFQASGSVYNLSVEEDESYVANGFAVHNCAMCMGMDGTFHGLWEDLSDHPCGKCSPLPVTKDWSEIFASHGFGDIDTSELGDTRITRSYVSGEERFRTMSAAQQERIIGTRTGYEAYRRGELELRDFTGVKPPENGFPAQYYQKSLRELQIPTRQGKLVERSPDILAKMREGNLRYRDYGRVTPLSEMPKWATKTPARENVYQILRNGLPYNMTEHERPLLLMNLEQMLAEADLPANVRAAAEKLYEAMRAEEQRLATGVWHSMPGGGRAYAPARKAATELVAKEAATTSTRTVMSAAEAEAKAELKAARSQVNSLARKLDKAAAKEGQAAGTIHNLTPDERAALGLKAEVRPGSKLQVFINQDNTYNAQAIGKAAVETRLSTFGEHQIAASLHELDLYRLQEAARGYGLSTSGRKSQLISRIVSHVTEGRYNGQFTEKAVTTIGKDAVAGAKDTVVSSLRRDLEAAQVRLAAAQTKVDAEVAARKAAQAAAKEAEKQARAAEREAAKELKLAKQAAEKQAVSGAAKIAKLSKRFDADSEKAFDKLTADLQKRLANNPDFRELREKILQGPLAFYKEAKSYEYAVQEWREAGEKVLSREAWLDRAAIDHIVEAYHYYAGGSSSASPLQVALQEAAKAEFGIVRAAQVYTADQLAAATAEYGEYQAGLRAMLREMYEKTQATFAKQGITEVRLYRGMRVSESSHLSGALAFNGQAAEARIALQPISSFSVDPAQAYQYASQRLAEGERGLFVMSTVPASQILSIPGTGFGAGYMQEVVSLGGQVRSVLLGVTRNEIPSLNVALSRLDEAVQQSIIRAAETTAKEDIAFATSRATEDGFINASASYDLTASDKRFVADLKQQIDSLDQHNLAPDHAIDIGGQINARIAHDPTFAPFQQAADDAWAIQITRQADLTAEQIAWMNGDADAVAAHGGVGYIDAVARYKAEKQARALTYLQEVREMGGADLRLDTTAEKFDERAAQTLLSVRDQLPRDWIEASNSHGDLIVERLTSRNYGGWYQPSAGTDGNGVMALPVSSRANPIDVQSVALHEFMHRMEDVLPQIGRLEEAYYNSRTAGEAFVDLTNGIREKTKLDQWADEYLGRAPHINRGPLYLDPNGLDVGYRMSYELLSMGAEALYGGGSTYDLIALREDEDFMNFVLGLLSIVRADAGVGMIP